MIGIFAILLVSWWLLYLIEKKHLNVLGLTPPGKRARELAVGFLVAALLCVASQLIELWLKSGNLVLTESASLSGALFGLWWDFKSVLTEELIYRGALLFILIRRLGKTKGMVISAAAFGIYHWFSFGVFGNLVPMILIFIGTGLMGYAWALSYYKTRSIMLGFGFHLGWNFVYNTVFSNGPLGDQILVLQEGKPVEDLASLVTFLVPMVAIPLIILIGVKTLVVQESWTNQT